MTPDIEGGTILLCEYGSTAHGTSNAQSDKDYMGIVVEPREFVIGQNEWEQSQIKTADKGERSTKDDTDTTFYSLRKWARLAAKGNPTVLTPLFVSEYEKKTELGQLLLDGRDAFISKEAGRRFLGYMTSQRLAMTGMRNKRTNRPELVHIHGFDTKFAYHMIRLGIQGITLMETGKLELPLDPTDALNLLDIRGGKYDKQYVLDWSDHLEEQLKKAIQISWLPEQSDFDRVNRLLIDIHQSFWEHGNW